MSEFGPVPVSDPARPRLGPPPPLDPPTGLGPPRVDDFPLPKPSVPLPPPAADPAALAKELDALLAMEASGLRERAGTDSPVGMPSPAGRTTGPLTQAARPEPEPAGPPMPSSTAWVGEVFRLAARPSKRKLVAAAGVASLFGGAAVMKWAGPQPTAGKEPIARGAEPGTPLPPPVAPTATDPPAAGTPAAAADQLLGGPTPTAVKLHENLPPVNVPAVDSQSIKLADPLAQPAAPAAAVPPPKMDIPQLGFEQPDRPTPPPAKLDLPPVAEASPRSHELPGGAPVIPMPKVTDPNLQQAQATEPKINPPAITPSALDVPKPGVVPITPPAIPAPAAPGVIPPPTDPAKPADPPKVELPKPITDPPKVELPKPVADPPKLDLPPVAGPAAEPPKPVLTPEALGPPPSKDPIPKPAAVEPPALKPVEVAPVVGRPDVPPPGELMLRKPAGSADPAVRPASAVAPRTDVDDDLHYPKAGDSYASVSRQFYGDEKYADALQRYNGGGAIAAVSPVKVPPMHYLRRNYGGATRPAAEATPVRRSEAAPAGGLKAYTVPAGGRTMKQLATDALGDPNRWSEVFDLNRRLRSDEVIAAGTKVYLPAGSAIGE